MRLIICVERCGPPQVRTMRSGRVPWITVVGLTKPGLQMARGPKMRKAKIELSARMVAIRMPIKEVGAKPGRNFGFGARPRYTIIHKST